jgi:hypothetical protein
VAFFPATRTDPPSPAGDGAGAEETARQNGEVSSQRARDALRHAVDHFMNDLEIVGPELRTVIASLAKLLANLRHPWMH